MLPVKRTNSSKGKIIANLAQKKIRTNLVYIFNKKITIPIKQLVNKLKDAKKINSVLKEEQVFPC